MAAVTIHRYFRAQEDEICHYFHLFPFYLPWSEIKSLINNILLLFRDSLVVQMKSACNAGDMGSVPELGRSSGEGNGYPFQHSCLENSMDTGVWKATIHGVAESDMMSLSCVQLFETPWTVACQAPLSMGFSRQEYWSGLSSFSRSSQPRDWTHLSCGSCMAGKFFTAKPPGKPTYKFAMYIKQF